MRDPELIFEDNPVETAVAQYKKEARRHRMIKLLKTQAAIVATTAVLVVVLKKINEIDQTIPEADE